MTVELQKQVIHPKKKKKKWVIFHSAHPEARFMQTFWVREGREAWLVP